MSNLNVLQKGALREGVIETEGRGEITELCVGVCVFVFVSYKKSVNCSTLCGVGYG
jgi:hypothetical protein